MDFRTEIVGIMAAVSTTAAFVPQVYKTWKSKSVEELSLVMYLVFLTGIILWLIYGVLLHSFAIILANIITGLLVLIIIYFILRYKN